MGGFEYGLQVGLPKPRIHDLEVFEERLDQARHPIPSLCPVLLFIDPLSQRFPALLKGQDLVTGHVVGLHELLFVQYAAFQEPQVLGELGIKFRQTCLNVLKFLRPGKHLL